jgi:cellulose 1,4-beta-cellobiosidase
MKLDHAAAMGRAVLVCLLCMAFNGCGAVTAGGCGTGGKACPQQVIPPSPAAVSATPGNQQVTLNWNASLSATGYHVRRSTTSGGPYTQIAAPAANSYIDSGLSTGNAYYYVVSAFDAVGESGNSLQVSGTPN